MIGKYFLILAIFVLDICLIGAGENENLETLNNHHLGIFLKNREKRGTDCWSTGFGCIDGGCYKNGGSCGSIWIAGSLTCRCDYFKK
uniref:Uncharacterized protein n=1 Tax=Acrobeloides nanus TaxID=290746 RepID=A0A914BY22_9BILA